MACCSSTWRIHVAVGFARLARSARHVIESASTQEPDNVRVHRPGAGSAVGERLRKNDRAYLGRGRRGSGKGCLCLLLLVPGRLASRFVSQEYSVVFTLSRVPVSSYPLSSVSGSRDCRLSLRGCGPVLCGVLALVRPQHDSDPETSQRTRPPGAFSLCLLSRL